MTLEKHPFIAGTQTNGSCAACDKPRINKIHNWTTADVPAVESIAKRMRALLRSSPAITDIEIAGDRQLVITHAADDLTGAVRSVRAAAGIMKVEYRIEGARNKPTVRITII